MTVRKLTLEEWFLDHQLQAIAAERFHIPAALDVDVTVLLAAWSGERRPPLTSIVVKAAGLLLRAHPDVNRTLFRTPIGPRLVESPHADVNVPVMLEEEGRRVLSATVVRDADTRTVSAISSDLEAARRRKLADLPIGKHLRHNQNTLVTRTRLRALHWATWHLPWLYARQRGGGIAVSSLLRGDSGALPVRSASFGPNALTIGLFALTAEGGRQVLHLGVGIDHSALSGAAAQAALLTLDRLLREPHPTLLPGG